MTGVDDILAALTAEHDRQSEVYRRASAEGENARRRRERAEEAEQKAAKESLAEYRKLEAIKQAMQALTAGAER